MEPSVLIWQKGLSVFEAKEIERELIIRWGRRGADENGILTNCIIGGLGGEGHRKDTRERMRQLRTGKPAPAWSLEARLKSAEVARNRPKHLIDAQVQRMLASAAARKGKPLSKEHRQKLCKPQSEEARHKKSIALKGRKTSNGMLGRKHSEETLAKMRKSKTKTKAIKS